MTTEAERLSVVVIGAGPAGLGVAAELGRRGVGATVLERSEAVGASWRSRYPDLRLNTDRSVSGLPGARIPHSAGRWPSRNDYVAFLESYAARNRLDVRFGTEVERVERAVGGWLLRSSAGSLSARFVIVCTGHDREPRLPAWPGVDEFSGELLHAAEFQDAASYADRSVLVVGLGTSGTEIATRLAPRAAKVWLSFRSSPNLMPEQVLGIPITLWARLFEVAPDWLTDRLGRLVGRLTVGDLSSHRLPPAPHGPATELKVKRMGPVIDRGFSDAVRAGAIELVPAVEGFDLEAVVLDGGTRLRPDAVIAATGYRSGLEPLVGHLGVLRPTGGPAVLDRSGAVAPGLFVNGYWLPLAGELPAIRRTSRRITAAIVADLHSPPRQPATIG